MNDKAQMVVFESIVFAITAIVAVAFLISLSPTSIQTTKISTDLTTIGDDALNTIYAEQVDIISRGEQPYGGNITNDPNPTSKLVVCVITNNYEQLTYTLNQLLPKNVLYNIYVADQHGKTVFWNSSSPNEGELPSVGTVFISHHIIPIHPQHLTIYPNPFIFYGTTGHCDLLDKFDTFDSSTYDFILKMWYV
jgi:hypothetical protein